MREYEKETKEEEVEEEEERQEAGAGAGPGTAGSYFVGLEDAGEISPRTAAMLGELSARFKRRKTAAGGAGQAPGGLAGSGSD